MMKSLKGKNYIAFHVRATDNLGTLETDWDLYSRKIYRIARFMKVAQQLKKRDKSLRTIYVATDSQTVIDEITAYEEKGQYTEWKFVINTKARHIEMKDEPDPKDQFDW